MTDDRIRFFAKILIVALQTGQFFNLIEIILESIKAADSWNVFMERANGTYYKKQVDIAISNYQKLSPPKEQSYSLSGFDDWLKRNGTNK